MYLIRTLLIILIEVTVLWFALWAIGSNWVLPELNYGGDAGTWAWLLFLSVFSLSVISYLPLLASLKLRNKNARKVLFSIVVLGSIISALTLGRAFGSAYVFILPFILFAFHLGIAKILSKGK